VIQGLFRRRRTAVAAATKAGADGLAVSFIGGLLRSYGEGPLWIRVAKDEALLLLGRDAIRHGLEGVARSLRRRPGAQEERNGTLPAVTP